MAAHKVLRLHGVFLLQLGLEELERTNVDSNIAGIGNITAAGAHC